MIRIADLDRVGVEFLQRFLLRLRPHPVELLDPRSIGGFQVCDQLLNLRFCFRRKIFCGVKLANTEAHRAESAEAIADTKIAAAHGRDRAFPAHLLLLLAGKRFVAQFEVGVGERFER